MPPTVAYLADRDNALADCRDIKATYQAQGDGPAMARFIALVMFEGQVPDGYGDQPAPDPAMFGLSGEDDGSRTSPLMRNLPSCNAYQPDVDALRALGYRLIVAGGAGSGEQLAVRGARSVAAAVGVPVTEFPGDHGGFLGGEFGQQGEPDAFVAPTARRPRPVTSSTCDVLDL